MKSLKDKNIIQISAYYPPHIGGMESYVRNLSEKLAEKKYKVKVITSDVGATEKALQKENLEVTYLPSVEVLNTPVIPTLRSTLEETPSNSIFHLHVAQAVLPEIAALVAKKKKLPLVSHIHLDVGNSTGVGKIILPFYKHFFLRKVLQQSEKVIVQTEDYKKLIHQKYKVPLEKIVTIPNGVDLLPVKESRYENLRGPFKILFVGRLVNQKRPDLFIQTMAELKRRGHKIESFIVGGGPEEQKLRELATQLRIDDVIKFCGSLGKEDVQKMYDESDCLVQTSERESFSTVLLEALNAGCPIVATNIAGTRNILTNGQDALLTSDDQMDVADKVSSLITNQQLRKNLIRNGYKTVTQYSWSSAITQIESIYSNLRK
ncbi:glycosyltransferase family 4 protein [Patescibacteria group bacterium]|nr:glycosyltransferase family 4 protein [Patescibacteria group bacterium]